MALCSFPLGDCVLLPIRYSSVEEIAALLVCCHVAGVFVSSALATACTARGCCHCVVFSPAAHLCECLRVLPLPSLSCPLTCVSVRLCVCACAHPPSMCMCPPPLPCQCQRLVEGITREVLLAHRVTAVFVTVAETTDQEATAGVALS